MLLLQGILSNSNLHKLLKHVRSCSNVGNNCFQYLHTLISDKTHLACAISSPVSFVKCVIITVL